MERFFYIYLMKRVSPYELSNHLGNVLTVVSDRKIALSSDGTTVDYYLADIITATDYYAFGSPMPGRQFTSSANKYRYGFNGQEQDNEIAEGVYTAEYWEYDSRIGRRWNVDPVVRSWESPYACLRNSPVIFKDPNGDDPITALIDAAMSFGIDVGMDFMSAIILDGKSPSEAFNDIGWMSASWGAVKTYAISSVSIPGTATVMKIKKVTSSKIGKIVLSVAEKMGTKLGDNFMNGKYNDANGDFDFDLVNFEDVFYEAAIETLIEKGLGGQADKLLEKLDKENAVLAQKLRKLTNKTSNGESKKRIDNYTNTVRKQEAKVDASRNQFIVTKAKEKIVTGTSSKVVNKEVKEVKETKDEGPRQLPSF